MAHPIHFRCEVSTPGVQPLRVVLADVPDPRQCEGQRYEFDAILPLSCAAMLCGRKNSNQIATWGANQNRDYLRLLGFRRGKSIGKNALYGVVSRIDAENMERRLMNWLERAVATMKTAGCEIK